MKNNKVSMVDLIDRAQHIKTESGFWSDSWHKWDINYSSILTLLIKEAAKCERYSSDLFIDWRSIDQSLTDPDFQGDMWAFGFRQDGVDSLTFDENGNVTWAKETEQ